ncbi:MFS transporter [Crocosphaera subtropica]|nr:MFS transporter [Crocosphaera subtropica]
MMLNSIVNISEIWLAQALNEPPIESLEDAALVFSGPQFFTSLIAGVVLAFAFQLLLTNLGVALGISFAGGSSSKQDHHGLGHTIQKVSVVLGLGTLVSVTLALFFACLLAIKLSLFVSPLSGAIVGLVIWGTYFSLMVWISSTTVGSFIGSVVNTATAGFQAIMGTATAAFGAKAASKKAVDTAEATVAAVRREIGEAIDPVTLRENVEDYLSTLRPQPLNLDKLASDIENLIDEEDLQNIGSRDNLPNIDRQTFVDLVSNRSDLSQRDINRIADKLETVWEKITQKLPSQGDSLAEVTDFIKSATKEQLLGGELTQKLERLVEEMRKRRKSENPSMLSRSVGMGLNSLMGMVMGRTDLSSLDIDQIVYQINEIKEKLTEQSDKLAHRLTPTSNGNGNGNGHHLHDEIETYLLNAYPWNLQPGTLSYEFQDLLYEVQPNPEQMAKELETIDRSEFVTLLQEKGILTQEKIETTANVLEKNRLQVLDTAYAAIEQQKRLRLLADVKHYLYNAPKEDLLNPEKLQIQFKPILTDSKADESELKRRLAQFDIPTFERLLVERHDIEVGETVFITPKLEEIHQQVIKESEDQQAAIQGKVEQQWLKLQTYLQETGKEQLHPQAIKQELQLLLDDPQAGAKFLRARASRFDRDTLVKLLSQREDLSERQINEILDQVESVWTTLLALPNQLAGKIEEQYEQITSAIADYLRNTDKTELNPEGIKRDLTKLLTQPQVGLAAIRQRLSMMDRDTLVQLLSQREDLSEAEVNRIIDQVMATLRQIIKAPQRIAKEAKAKVQQFETALEDYLRSTDRQELNPEGIKRDVRLLLNDPKAGTESLQERLASFDRKTLVALLSQRDDISEDEVNRIIDTILEVRNQFLHQIDRVKQRIQAAIDRILDKIRRYLNSLERPELNYQGIRHDLQELFHDPQAGFEALRDRFSQVNRDTVIAILESRDDISHAQAERIVGQVEHSRDRILQRAERIQQAAKMRLEQVKEEAQHQARETKKAAATAAWWLFFTALVSGVASAWGGAIAAG